MRERSLRLAPVTAVVLLAAALAGAASSASASTFTVCASGCDFATITAANASVSVHSGDELIVKPGTYTDAPVLTKVLAVYGEPSQPMPVLAPSEFAATALVLGAGSEGSVVSHLELAPNEPLNGDGFRTEVPGTLSDAVIVAPRSFSLAAGTTLLNVAAAQTSELYDGATSATLRHVDLTFPSNSGGLLLSAFSGPGTVIEDSTFSSPGTGLPLGLGVFAPVQATLHRVRVDGGIGGIAIDQGQATITDSLVTATSGPALEAYGGADVLRNLTAISAGKSASRPSFGLLARGCAGSGCTPGAIAARNVIARGAEEDVDAEAATGSPGVAGTIAIDHSNIRSQAGSVTATATQSGDPLFVNGTVGPGEDFHLRAGSPAIDAGVSDPFDGSTDLDGAPRVQGAAIDIGAYEFTPPPPAPPPAPPAGSATGGGTPQVTAVATPVIVRTPATLALLAHTLRINAARHIGSLPVACSGSGVVDDICTVVGSLAFKPSKSSKAHSRKQPAAVRLGTVTGAVQAASHGSLTVRLTASALALLRRHGSLSTSLTATVTSAGGTRQLSARLQLLLSAAPSAKR